MEDIIVLRSPRKHHQLNSDLVIQTLEIKTVLSVNGFHTNLKAKDGSQNAYNELIIMTIREMLSKTKFSKLPKSRK